MTEIAEMGLERLAQEILAIPWFRYSPTSGAGQLIQSDLPDKFAMAVLEAHQPDPRVSELLEALERLAKLTPKAANAGTAHELYCSVSAIAATALATFKGVPTHD